MQLSSIHLKNYRRYRDQFIELPTGIIGIVGRNGSGKTTILEAVEWCLYGSNAARTDKMEIRTTGASGADCSVTLEIVLGADTVKVVRELRGDGASARASVFLNGNDRAHVSGANEVSDYIARRTGMNRVAFSASVFARQKELSAFSDLQPSKRKETITRLLRIDTIDKVLVTIREDVRNGEKRIQILQEGQGDVDDLKARRQAAAKEAGRINANLKKYAQKISEAEAAAGRAETDFAAHKNRYERYNAINTKLAGLTAEIRGKKAEKNSNERDQKEARDAVKKLQEMQPQLARYGAAEQEKSALDAAKARFAEKCELEKQLGEMAADIKEIAGSNEDNRKAISRMNTLKTELQNQKAILAEKKERVRKIGEQIGAVSAENKEAERQKKEYEEKLTAIKERGEDGSCPTCERPLQGYYFKVYAQFTEDIAKLKERERISRDDKRGHEADLREAEKKANETEEEIRQTEASITEMESLQKTLKRDEGKEESLRKKEEDLARRLDGLSDLVYSADLHQAAKTEYDRLQQIKEESLTLAPIAERLPGLEESYEKFTNDAAALKERLEAENENLRQTGYDPLEYKRAERAEKKTVEKLAKAREARTKMKGDANLKNAELERIDNDIGEEMKKQKEMDDEREDLEARSKLDQVMSSFRQDLMSRIRPMLSQRTSEMLGEITHGRYSRVELDEDYNMRVEDEGESFNTKRFSGGEEDLANLCLRIAISMELTERSGGMQASFIALDEIFGSQDEERKRSILEALQILSGRFRQIMVITHIEDVKETLPYVLSVRGESGSASTITVEGDTAAGAA